jgi:hypothetical protein
MLGSADGVEEETGTPDSAAGGDDNVSTGKPLPVTGA